MRLAAAIGLLTLIRLVVAATAPLAPDEAYYWVWSRALAPGYVDHPPMVALWIRAGTMLAGDGSLGVRLLGPISAGLGSWLVADAANRLFPARLPGSTAALLLPGDTAAMLLNATLFLGVGSVIMTPDTPLLFFWCASLWAFARIAAGGSSGWWLAAGAFAGLALDSKYTAVLLWAGAFLWLLRVPSMRRWLRHPAPWVGGIIGFALFLPVLIWNQQHGWVSMLKQGGRVNDWQPARAATFLAELLGSQVGLATPLIWLLCAGGVVAAAQQAWRTRDSAWTLLAALSIPAALIFVQHALGDRVQGNWPAIIYPASCIAAAGLTSPFWRRLVTPAICCGFAITALAYAQACLALIPLPPRLDPIALRLGGWDALTAEVESARQAAGAAYIVADQYALAAELARAMPRGVPVIGTEQRWAYTTLPPAGAAASPGLLVRSARRQETPEPDEWPDVQPAGEAHRSVRGQTVEAYRLFRITGFPQPAVILPGRASDSR